MSKKIISFSLYGNNPNYQVGAIVNVIEARRLLPDWTCRFYTTDDEPIRNQLRYLGAEVFDMNKQQDLKDGNMFWRFLAVDDIDVDTVIVRDTDSIISTRELPVLDGWLNSNEEWEFCIVRDNPAHLGVPIPGGLWGYTKLKNKQNKINFTEKPMMSYIYDDWIDKQGGSVSERWEDQSFLQWLYHSYIENVASVLVYGPLHEWENGKATSKKIPAHQPTRYTKFIGSVVFENVSLFYNDRDIRGFDEDHFKKGGEANWEWLKWD